MFSGIVETVGKVEEIKTQGTNKSFVISSPISGELYIDQSISHNGVCLTVIAMDEKSHTVTAVEETLIKSNLGDLIDGSYVNIERCITMDTRLDGHMVQGHVDNTMECIAKENREGSWLFTFKYDSEFENLIVDKGSICINGTSLTVIDPGEGTLTVTIIPYTYDHTTFKHLNLSDIVNVEFDIIGKYVNKYMKSIRS